MSSNHSVAAGSRSPAWLLLFQAPALALRGRVLLLATLGLLAVWLLDAMLLPAPTAEETQAVVVAPTVERIARSGTAPLSDAWQALSQPFVALAEGEVSFANAIACVWRIAVWGLFGGAILRIAALSYTREESPDVAGALRYAWHYKAGTWGGPGLILAGLTAVWLPLLLVRLAMQVDWLAPLGAVAWPLLIVAAVLTTIYTIGVALGWPLASAATAADGSDAFDAVSRMFAYVYQKPLRLGGYALLALVLAVLSSGVATLFVAAVTYACVFAAGGATGWAADTMAWWQGVFAGLATAFLVAQLWTSAAGIYLLRRHDIDGVHLDEVHFGTDEHQSGLPKLQSGSTGVPELSPESAQDAA